MSRQPRRRGTRDWVALLILVTAFIGAAATSNWAVQHVGQNNGPYAPHTIPIGWGLQAASGVLFIGVMITVRDALHEQVGIKATLMAIVVASVVSALLAPASVALASGVTMLAAESADALVYQRLRRRGYLAAAAASNLVSSLIDSALFLSIAYGATAMWHGTYPLTVGKVEVSLITLAVVIVIRSVSRRTPALPCYRHARLRPLGKVG